MKITEIAIKLLDLDLTRSTGYGFSIGELKYKYIGSKCYIGGTKSLFHIGLYNSDNNSLYFSLIILGVNIIKYYIKPEEILVCKHCHKKVESLCYMDGSIEYLCDEHGKLKEDETEIIKIRPK